MNLAYAKAKGRAAEKDVADYARDRGFCHAHRKRMTGAKDEGDVFISELAQAVEVKNTKRCEISGFMAEAEAEAANAGSPIAVAIWKRARRPVGEWTALLSVDALLDLLARAAVPADTNSLWRALWGRAVDDIDSLLTALESAGVEAPHVHTEREVVGK